ncbi:large ribosomal subunit protein uL18m-like [Ciona intestinalis]
MLASKLLRVPYMKSIRKVLTSAEKLSLTSAAVDTVHRDEKKKSIKADIVPHKTFINRNPRNLERLALAHKDQGWGKGIPDRPATNWPTGSYHHRILFEVSGKHTYASLLHYHGNQVVAVSTREWSIQKMLYKGNDVSACYNIGTIFAERCIRAGISCASWTIPQNIVDNSDRIKSFCTAVVETGFVLEEPDQISFKSFQPPHVEKKGPRPPKTV